MKLTTKMIKDLIKEEIEEAKKEPTLKDVAEKLGVPMKEEEQVTTEGLENITPENIMLVLQALAKMGVELSPAALGGGVAAAALKIKDAKQNKNADGDDEE